MKKINLKPVSHEYKTGQECANLPPNVKDDCIFLLDGEPIGFFMRELPDKAKKLAILSDHELRSENVPKSMMNRSSGRGDDSKRVDQYSTNYGAIPPKANFRRNYLSISSVHSVSTAKNFIKAMYLLAKECENLIKELIPDQYNKQLKLFESVDKSWKIGNIFTSSISNYNINAPYHIDRANIPNTVNIIITKRQYSTGGNLHVPDYDAVVDQCDNSILVYPAWKSLHGVTPIVPLKNDGYRNSLVFYPLKAFLNTTVGK